MPDVCSSHQIYLGTQQTVTYHGPKLPSNAISSLITRKKFIHQH